MVPADVVDIDTGYFFQVYRTRSGQLLGVGSNTQGQLGDGTLIDRTTPTPILLPGPVVAYTVGGAHAMAIPLLASGSTPGEVSFLEATVGTEVIRPVDEYVTAGDPVDVSSGAPVQFRQSLEQKPDRKLRVAHLEAPCRASLVWSSVKKRTSESMVCVICTSEMRQVTANDRCRFGQSPSDHVAHSVAEFANCVGEHALQQPASRAW